MITNLKKKNLNYNKKHRKDKIPCGIFYIMLVLSRIFLLATPIPKLKIIDPTKHKTRLIMLLFSGVMIGTIVNISIPIPRLRRMLIQSLFLDTTDAKTKIETKIPHSNILSNMKDKDAAPSSTDVELLYRANFFSAGIKEICRIWIDRDCKETPEQMAKLLLTEYTNRA